MRPQPTDYIAGYVWRSKTEHADQFGRPVKVKTGEGYVIFVRFEDGTTIACGKCCVRRTK